MGIRSRSAKDLPSGVRKEGAARARAHLRQLLANPLLTANQAAMLHAKLSDIAAWERGDTDSLGNNHVVELSEDLTLEES